MFSADPVNTGTGNLFETQVDFATSAPGGLVFKRYYNSLGAPNPGIFPRRWGDVNWHGSYDRTLFFFNAGNSVASYREDGKILIFSYDSNSDTWKSDADVNATITQVSSTLWSYSNTETDETETYDDTGRLLSIVRRNGEALALVYSDGTSGTNGGYVLDASGNPTASVLPAGEPIRVSDSFGRSLQFGYDNDNRTVKMTTPNGESFLYAYDSSGNLSQVTYPDGNTRAYLYNEPGLTGGVDQAYSLTGIVDENGQPYATFSYDADARAVSAEHAGEAEKTTFTYNGDGTTTVTDARQTSRTFSFQNVVGTIRSTGVSQPCTTGCSNASATTYDANGNVASRTDFNGNVTNYTYDLTRNLETSRTEAYGTAQARTITTTWHPTYRLPTEIDEPGKTTTFSYDTSGNLLSKTITDTSTSQSRIWSWTYNSLGQVLTADGPRTDVSDLTTYTYYTAASTTTGSAHAIGDLATVTDALGHVTQITNYDGNGRPLSMTGPNSVVTTLTYDARGRLLTRTTAGQTTTYDYDGVGQLTKVTLADGSYLSYTYDTAHRLTDITDNLGNTVHYTLDLMGNRTQEDTKDPNGNLTQTRSRVYDALNRLQQDIGGTSPTTQITQYGYDDNGNLTTVTDPNSHVTSNGYDALNRLVQITDPAAGVTHNAYDSLGQLTSVSDPRSVTTNYVLNALGDATQVQSPDSGTANNVYDAAGNLTQKTDARGVVSQYAYDALNRLTGITYPGHTSENATFTYDDTSNGNNGIGHLTGYSNDGGSSALVYDALGNLTQQTDTVDGQVYVTSYQYDSANRLTQITYPSGRIVIYTRNSLGQITQVQTQDDANATAQTVVSNVTYEPFGPVHSLTFGNGVVTTLQHDEDYRLSQSTTTSSPQLDFVFSYDPASNISQVADQVGSAGQTLGYDALDRITDDTNANGVWGYQYDANGNRTELNLGGFAITQTYASTSNRDATFFGSTVVEDAVGNITTYGGSTYSYNNANRMSQVVAGSVTTNYFYNALGQRTRKDGAQLMRYSYLQGGQYLEELQLNADLTFAQRNEYIWLDDLPIAQVHTVYGSSNAVSSRELAYIHADQLNAPRAMTNAGGTVVWRWDHDAYGMTVPATDPDGDGTIVTLDLRFPGQIADAETGFYYNINRYYASQAGRYLQSDPIGLQGGMNTYAYVNGNPISRLDFLGLIDTTETAWCRQYPTACPEVLGGHSATSATANAAGAVAVVNAATASDKKKCDKNEPDCQKASPWQLEAAGIFDEHGVKNDYGAKPWSRYDLCACKDGSIVIKAVGTCGTPAPIWEITDYRWKP